MTTAMAEVDNNTVIFVIEDPTGEGQNTYVLSGDQVFNDNVSEIVLEVNDGMVTQDEGGNVVYQLQDSQALPDAAAALAGDEQMVLSADGGQLVNQAVLAADPLVLNEGRDSYAATQAIQITPENIPVVPDGVPAEPVTLPGVVQSIPTEDGKSRISLLQFDPSVKFQQPLHVLTSGHKFSSGFQFNCEDTESAPSDGVLDLKREFDDQDFEFGVRKSKVRRKSQDLLYEQTDMKPDIWELFGGGNIANSPSTASNLLGMDGEGNLDVSASKGKISILSTVEDDTDDFGPYLPYKCSRCSSSFQKKLSLSVHELVHDELRDSQWKLMQRGKFSCPVCGAPCDKRKDLKVHLQNEHDTQAFFSCNLCKFSSLSSQEHADHLKEDTHCSAQSSWKERTKSQPHPFLCNMCGYSAINVHRLEAHMVTHMDRKDFACPHCSYKGKTEVTLKKHLQTHETKKSFQCPECSYKTNDTYSVARHMKRVHVSKEKKFKCRHCDAAFVEMCELRVHSMLIHKSIHSLFCSKCEFSCSNKAQYWKHLDTHSTSLDADLHHCSQCEYSCRKLITLKRHEKRHFPHLKPFKCSQCPQRFHERGDKRRHMRIHSDDKPFVCPICQHKCKFRNVLTLHMKVHADVKQYQCTQCEYSTKYSGNLKKHMSVHEKDKVFACQFCAYRASNNKRMRQHLFKVHMYVEQEDGSNTTVVNGAEV